MQLTVVIDGGKPGRIRTAFHNAIKWLTEDDRPSWPELPKEKQLELEETKNSCRKLLRKLQEKMEAAVNSEETVFERAHSGSRMEEQMGTYHDMMDYMSHNLYADWQLWEDFRDYLEKINRQPAHNRMLEGAYDLRSVMYAFDRDWPIIIELLTRIFHGNSQSAREIISAHGHLDFMRGLSRELRNKILHDLLTQDSKTIHAFLNLLKPMPKKFIIDHDQRIDLLMDFASRHKDLEFGQLNFKMAMEFIEREEEKHHPYR
ncbi:hypothetical protein IT411_03415 [Candidatus Peregrinibacteria bacterium]|nr:hypothetical protein [Candidatus Peregrinibacteria bacterium]